MGSRFGLVVDGFFSWGYGGGEEDSPGQVLQSRFHRRRPGSNNPIFTLHIICVVVGVSLKYVSIRQTITNGVTDPR